MIGVRVYIFHKALSLVNLNYTIYIPGGIIKPTPDRNTYVGTDI